MHNYHMKRSGSVVVQVCEWEEARAGSVVRPPAGSYRDINWSDAGLCSAPIDCLKSAERLGQCRLETGMFRVKNRM